MTPVEPPPSPSSPTAPPASVDHHRTNTGRMLMVTGGIVTGVGVLGGALSIAGFSMADSAVETFEREPNQRDDAAQRNRNGNAMGIAGGIVAGIANPTGIALLVVGAKRKKTAHDVAIVPYGGHDASGVGHGVTVTGRF